MVLHNQIDFTNSLISSGYDASFLKRDLYGFVCLFETLAIAMGIFRPLNTYSTGTKQVIHAAGISMSRIPGSPHGQLDGGSRVFTYYPFLLFFIDEDSSKCMKKSHR